MSTFNRPDWQRISAWVMLTLVLALTACDSGDPGARAGGGEATTQSAEATHAAFLAALRASNREGVLALTVDDQQAQRVDEFLQRVQAYMDSTITEGPYATGGRLSDVRVTRLEERDTATHAWSHWQYARKAVCHETELTQTQQGWRVLEFYIPGSAEHCEP